MNRNDFPKEKQDKWILSDDNKQDLLLNFSHERMRLAFEFASTNKINTSLIQVLKWHCSQQIPPFSHRQKEIQKKEFMSENSKTSEEFFNQCRPISSKNFFDFDKEKNVMKVGIPDRPIEEISVFEPPNIFRNMLKSSLEKFGLWKPIKENIIEFPQQEIAMEN